MILESIENLVDESVDLSEFDISTEDLIELGLTEKDLEEVKEEIASVAGGIIAAKGMSIGAGGAIASSGGLTGASAVTATVAGSTSVLLGIPLAIFAAVAGGLLIYRYLNSINRLKKVIEAYKKKITATQDPKAKKKLTDKMNAYQLKLEKAQAIARVKKTKFIQDTKDMTSKLNEMKQSKADPAKIKKLEDQLQKRNKIMSKLGHIS